MLKIGDGGLIAIGVVVGGGVGVAKIILSPSLSKNAPNSPLICIPSDSAVITIRSMYTVGTINTNIPFFDSGSSGSVVAVGETVGTVCVLTGKIKVGSAGRPTPHPKRRRKRGRMIKNRTTV